MVVSGNKYALCLAHLSDGCCSSPSNIDFTVVNVKSVALVFITCVLLITVNGSSICWLLIKQAIELYLMDTC